MSWDRPFDQPVPLPEGPPAQTLRDAADYISNDFSPEGNREQATERWAAFNPSVVHGYFM